MSVCVALAIIQTTLPVFTWLRIRFLPSNNQVFATRVLHKRARRRWPRSRYGFILMAWQMKSKTLPRKRKAFVLETKRCEGIRNAINNFPVAPNFTLLAHVLIDPFFQSAKQNPPSNSFWFLFAIKTVVSFFAALKKIFFEYFGIVFSTFFISLTYY